MGAGVMMTPFPQGEGELGYGRVHLGPNPPGAVRACSPNPLSPGPRGC